MSLLHNRMSRLALPAHTTGVLALIRQQISSAGTARTTELAGVAPISRRHHMLVGVTLQLGQVALTATSPPSGLPRQALGASELRSGVRLQRGLSGSRRQWQLKPEKPATPPGKRSLTWASALALREGRSSMAHARGLRYHCRDRKPDDLTVSLEEPRACMLGSRVGVRLGVRCEG